MIEDARVEHLLRRSPVFCALPWLHICGSVDGVWGRCCLDRSIYYDHYYREREKPVFALRDDALGCARLSAYAADNPERVFSLLEAFDSPQMRDTRSAMLSEARREACRCCYERERCGGLSYRRRSNDLFAQLPWREILSRTGGDGSFAGSPCYLDLRLGNACHLACRMCAFPHSSAWRRHLESGWPQALIDPYSADRELWTILRRLAPQLQRVYFAGGEPLLQAMHGRLLEMLIQSGHASHIDLVYSTSLSLLPESFGPALLRFRSAEIEASCDGRGELFERIRRGASWEQFARNLESLRPYGRITLAVTVQRDNLDGIEELTDWAAARGLPVSLTNVLQHPAEMNVMLLPRPARMEHAARLRAGAGRLAAAGHEQAAGELRRLADYLASREDG